MKYLVFLLLVIVFGAVGLFVLASLRWSVTRLACKLWGHRWVEIDNGELFGIARCRCGKIQLTDVAGTCECRHDRFDHQVETPDGACAHHPCGCRSWNPT